MLKSAISVPAGDTGQINDAIITLT